MYKNMQTGVEVPQYRRLFWVEPKKERSDWNAFSGLNPRSEGGFHVRPSDFALLEAQKKRVYGAK